MWFRRTLVSSYSSVMRAIANSFAQKSMKQISVSPVLVSDEKELLVISKEGLAFFSNHTIKYRNTKEKNDQVEWRGRAFWRTDLVLSDTRLKAFLTISFKDFERRNHGSQRAEMNVPITLQRNCCDHSSHKKFNKRGSIFSMGVQLSNGRYI